MNLKIREANINDYTEVYNLVLEVYKLHLKGRPDVYLEIDNPLAKEDYNDLLNSNTSKIFVAQNLDNKKLAAYSILQVMTTKNPMLIPKTFIYIDDFCVSSNFKRTGIGKMMFNYIVDYAKSKKADSLQLNVWEFNKAAIKFYEAMGMSTRNRKMEFNLQ